MERLPPDVARTILAGIASGMSTVFLWSIPLAILVGLLAWFIREVPLRGHDDGPADGGPAATPEEEAETAAARVPATP